MANCIAPLQQLGFRNNMQILTWNHMETVKVMFIQAGQYFFKDIPGARRHGIDTINGHLFEEKIEKRTRFWKMLDFTHRGIPMNFDLCESADLHIHPV